MGLSVYVHIPYCLQRCRYCDFTTFEQSEILPPEKYVGWVVQEIRHRHQMWPNSEIQTLYFGGGTPSLISPELIVAISSELANVGFTFAKDAELTLEINPATLTEEKLERYLRAGFNRFSVGAQTFDNSLLQTCGRRHSAEDTRETLRLLKKYHLNYSFDLLFALPGQTLAGLKLDLEEVAAFAPPHLSAYCLTVPEGHPMSTGRPPEDDQVEMFALIERELLKSDIRKYEISNFAKPGFESRHNMAYWRDVSYWGIGLSSHSYSQEHRPHGLRFWNPKSLTVYGNQVSQRAASFPELLPADQWEALAEHEMLTDLCHMFLRTIRGLPDNKIAHKCAPDIQPRLMSRLASLKHRGLLQHEGGAWSLTAEGQLISNRVFAELTFLREELITRGSKLHPESSLCRDGLTGEIAATYCGV